MATLPAYESDLFGPRHVGAIHSRSQKSPSQSSCYRLSHHHISINITPRFLLSTTVAALAGPALLLNLRSVIERERVVVVVDIVVLVVNFVVVLVAFIVGVAVAVVVVVIVVV